MAEIEKTPDLTQDEMVEILKSIARDGHNGAARIAAIRELRAIQGGEKPSSVTVAQLYEVGKPGPRAKAA